MFTCAVHVCKELLKLFGNFSYVWIKHSPWRQMHLYTGLLDSWNVEVQSWYCDCCSCCPLNESHCNLYPLPTVHFHWPLTLLHDAVIHVEIVILMQFGLVSLVLSLESMRCIVKMKHSAFLWVWMRQFRSQNHCIYIRL